MTVPACVLNTLPHVNTSVVNDLRSLKLTGCDPAATATLQQARPSSMATPTQLQKVSQRVKNASLKLTTESTTHAPFMRRVNEIIKEFRVEKAIELKFRMGTQVEARRHSAIKSSTSCGKRMIILFAFTLHWATSSSPSILGPLRTFGMS